MIPAAGAPPRRHRLTSSDLPDLSFAHLLRLSDDTGVLEHARGAMPRRNHGYCVDDVSRALLVISREAEPPADVARLGERCLAFLAHAQVPDGRFHNRMGYDRRFEDEPGTGDWWGRALWGLGVAAATHPDRWVRDEALVSFTTGCLVRSPHPRAMAVAALGAAAVVEVVPAHAEARRLLRDAAEAIGRPGSDPAWPWPHPRLTYGNATLPDALIAAGSALDDHQLLQDGLVMLRWLVDVEIPNDHLSLTAVAGWGPGEARPGFDQQPIEASALADAAARALAVTGDPAWGNVVAHAAAWFLGANDVGVTLFEPETGGGYDGLHAGGRNVNQGAESTLAYLSTMQQARRLLTSSAQ